MSEPGKSVSPDLVSRLRALANYQHDDLSLADDAADEIQRLRKKINLLENYLGDSDSHEKESHAR